jgi:hypothetical protein
MAKISFIISDENDRQLLEIQKRYKISKSDSVRRGIEMLHDYLIKDVQPEKSEAGKITVPAEEPKAEAEGEA